MLHKGSPKERARQRAKNKTWAAKRSAEQKTLDRIRKAAWWRKHANERNERRREKHFRWTPRGKPSREDAVVLEMFGRNFSATIITADQLRNPLYKIFSPRRPPEIERLDTDTKTL